MPSNAANTQMRTWKAWEDGTRTLDYQFYNVCRTLMHYLYCLMTPWEHHVWEARHGSVSKLLVRSVSQKLKLETKEPQG
ncbi:uncharacterized protein LOC116012729 isoform X3 [Ipomoea triloba]|uniref:uncharacterized protein LOC116012729 isoform X3 n=1 Tax=Ipomoea triloba TaxID=35885 RepID=UPI00125DF093|nr:uncharacterized protein LOC116012729 isoform X3 [Ipomoea triloba]